ncbi:hypothetical protein [Vreelandella arctica]|uniref:hypothetical protein n=1 Tax=Vreelandella arctica TaxID=3126499 RepID=UPI00300DF1DB|tara:strand:- start:238 stop:528 length:291 start_codon:yes stop_codon:yes gene_type:complete
MNYLRKVELLTLGKHENVEMQIAKRFTSVLLTLQTQGDHQRVIHELQALIGDTQTTLRSFEETGMDANMPEDYDKLLAILDDAIKQQREYTKMLLA